MRTKLRGKITLLFMTCAVLLAVPAIALADDFRNNLDATFDADFETVSLQAGQVPAQTQTVNIVLQGQGSDGEGGCNVDTGEGPVTVKAKSSNSSVASVKWVSTNTDTVNFTDCAAPNSKNLLVTAGSAGSANVTLEITNGTLNTTTGLYTVSSTGSGTYDVRTAQFTVNVTPPPNTPPTVSVTGVTNGAIYDKGAVPAAGCSVSDAEDTGESATPVKDSSALDSDGLGSEKVTCSYTDGGGLTTTASATYTIRDPSGPVITKVVTPASPNGDNGWYKSGNVTVVWTVSDPESPNSIVKTGCVDQNITTDQAATTYTCSATSAGGSAPEQSVTIKRDATAPTNVAGVLDRAADSNGWYNHAINATFSGDDDTSGIASCSSDGAYSGPDGTGKTVTGSCTDEAGNSANGSSPTFNYDATAPDVTADADRAADSNGWYNHALTVSFSGTDATSGNVSCDNAVNYNGPDSNNHSISGSCTDDAGNSASDTFTFKYDATAPTLSGTRSPGANSFGWNNTDVEVGWNCNDALSGVPSCPAAVILSSEGADQSVTRTVTDDAGNSASATVDHINIDKSAPTGIAFVGGGLTDGQSYDFNSVPAGPTGCTADGAISGLQPAPDGCKVEGYGTGLGPHTVTATAKDKAGNTSTKTLSYSVAAANAKGFYQPVDMGNVTNTVKGGSTVPLKFELFGGATNTEQKALPAVSSVSAKQITCGTTPGSSDAIEEIVSTNATGLRFDTTGDQFIYNWKTPKSPGTCYLVTMTAADNTTKLLAYFKLS